ncbi:hypothetical protein VTO42DRAFT_684 [Malbranchea cinnamomea]
MFSLPCFRTALSCSKRLKVSSPIRSLSTTAPRRSETPKANEEQKPSKIPPSSEPAQPQNEASNANTVAKAPEQPKSWMERMETLNDGVRLPRSVQAVYFKPLKRQAQYGLPVCDLQLRSYSTRHVEFFADFALRAAYYLGLPASGPIPLPRITERWTVIRSPFIFKKSQENFERITLRRLIQIKDGHPEVVQAWLAFLRKHAFHGVGMKANVWEHAPLDFVQTMDAKAKDIEKALETEFGLFGTAKNAKPQKTIMELIERERFSNKGMPLTEVRKG